MLNAWHTYKEMNMALLNLSTVQQSALRWMRIYAITPADARKNCVLGHSGCSIYPGGICAKEAQKSLAAPYMKYTGPERRKLSSSAV